MGVLETSEYSNHIEIIDLASNTSTCPEFPNFPMKLVNVYGGLSYKNGPIICGGINDQNVVRRDCSKYADQSWIQTDTFLANYYALASFTFNPDVTGNGRIVISGGSSSQVLYLYFTIQHSVFT